LKEIIIVTIKAHSRSSLKGSEALLKDAIEEARSHMNNGTSIKSWSVNGNDPREVEGLMGKLKWFSLDREHGPGQFDSPKRKGFWEWLGEQAKDVFNEGSD